MRITEENANFIKDKIKQLDSNARVYLFGSRVKDNLKGGDIDILVLSDVDLSISKINKVKIAFYKQFGERKLDIVVFSNSEESSFKSLALSEGIEL
ncbi:MAG: nucleotidyltransferase family protein [Vampirovibrionia bacterium]